MSKCVLESNTGCFNFQAFSVLLPAMAGGRGEEALAYVWYVSQNALKEEQNILF